MKVLLGYESYQARSAGSTGRRLVNMYMEPNPEGSKYPFNLYNTEGLVEFCDLGTTKSVDGMQVMGGSLYAVSGNSVFKIEENASVSTLTGSLTGTEGRVDLSNNGTQLTIIDPDYNGWVATSSSVSSISDGDFPDATSVTFLDGYTIITKNGTGQFNISALYDSTDYDALDFATAEETPDNLVRCTAFNSALWLFGTNSIEPYYNSGNADFPFEQISGSANTTRGLAARFAVAQDDNGLFFLGNDRIVYRVVGYTPQRISDHAVETALSGFTTINDAFMFISNLDGHKFLVVTFPIESKTWVFDLATQRWHERVTLINGNEKRWRPNCYAEFGGKQLVGDYINGKIYQLSPTVYTEDGETIRRIVQGSVRWTDGNRSTIDRLRLDIDAGENSSGEGLVSRRFSDDRAKSWSNEAWRSFGEIGEYDKRCEWRAEGQTRERIYEFAITNNTGPVRITGCYINDRVGLP